jgi:hypothetical protein
MDEGIKVKLFLKTALEPVKEENSKSPGIWNVERERVQYRLQKFREKRFSCRYIKNKT